MNRIGDSSWIVARMLSDEVQARKLFDHFQFDESDDLPVTVYRSDKTDEWCVEVLFSDVGLDEISKRLTIELGAETAAKFTVEELSNEDWVAKGLERLSPVRAGRYFVHGSHHRSKFPGGAITIKIDAAMAFGTGHHASTKGCLLEIDRLTKSRHFSNCLDLGTGSGILAIAIAKRAHLPVLATEMDPVAVRIATQNTVINQVGQYVRVVCTNGVNNRIIQSRQPYDLIVANILANPLVAMSKEVARLLAAKGTLVLSGLLESDGPRVLSAYSVHGLRLVKRTILNGWLTLTLIRGRSQL